MTAIENITITSPTQHERELTITLPGTLVTKEYEQTLSGIQRVASRPGFRPGKMPKNMVQNFYGAEIKRTLIKNLMEHSFEEACKSEDLTPISDPKMEVMGDCEREKAFTYRAAFQVKPKIEIKNIEGLSFEIKKFVFGPEDIEDELKNLRENHATFVAPKDRQEIGPLDIVDCDSEVMIDGVVNVAYSHKDYSVPLFAENVPNDLRSALIGKKVGEKAQVSYTMPEDHQDEAIKGKVCEMILSIKSFKERVLPALDDDFAKDLSDKFTSLDDLRESVNARFLITARRRDEYYKQDGITRALVENNDFDVPPVLVERMALNLINRELESLPKDVAEDAVKNQWAMMWQSVQKHAQFRVKSQLLFEALITKLDIKASHEEIHEYMRRIKDAKHEDAAYTIQIEKLLAAIEKTSHISVVEEPLYPKG